MKKILIIIPERFKDYEIIYSPHVENIYVMEEPEIEMSPNPPKSSDS